MTKQKSLKRALISSVLALALCFTMLIGTTYAWFTDSVTSANNVIKSGTLEIEFTWAKGNEDPTAASTAWTDASEGPIFNNQLWEPGYTEARHFKLKNVGTLALKYQFAIVPNGEVSKLADVIDVYLYDGTATQVANRTALDASKKIGTLAELINNGIKQGNLEANAEYNATIVLKMQESAGNEYQNLSIGSDFAIRVLATQYTKESDSFGPDYDSDAWVPGMQVYTASDLQAAINAGETNIKLMDDITLDEAIVIPASVTTFSMRSATPATVIDLNGKKLSNANGFVIYNEGNLVITGKGTIESTAQAYAIRVQQGSMVIDSADVEVKGAFGAVSIFNGANVTINGGNYSAAGMAGKTSHTIYMGGYGTLNINGGSFYRAAGGDSGGVVVGYGWENENNEKAVININGGTFNSEAAWGWISNYDGSWTTITATGGVFGRNPSSYVADGFKAIEKDGYYYVVSDTVNNIVVTPADLATAIAQGGTVYVANDIDMNNAWTSVKPTAELTILGNGNRITNLNLPLLAGGVSTKVTFKGLTVADSNVAPAAFENGLGSGAYVPYVDADGYLTFEDCHLVNSTVTGNERAGGFIGYTSGQTLSFKNCTVDKCEISAVGGAAGLVAYYQTATTIDGCSVTNIKVTATEDRLGTKAALAGSVIGTVNADTVINNVTASGNTVSNNNALPAFSNEIGRKVSGNLTIDGKTVVTDASNLANGGNLVLGGDIQSNTAINKDATIDLNGNTFEATGSYNLSNNADFTMTNGDYVVNSTYGHIDVRPNSAEGSVLTFENVDFTSNYKNKTNGTCTDRLVSVLETAPEAGAHIVAVFKNCTFDNAKVYIEGMSGGAGTFEVTFENCTFNALTSSAPIEVKNYMKGTITVKNCTFNLECTSASASAIAVSPSSSTEVTIVAENNTINATAAIASGESGTVEQVKVLGTPANIKFISCYANTTVTETGTVKLGIAA